jgi:hypothetical protein
MTLRRALLAIAYVLTAHTAKAQIASDQPAALVVYPLVFVDDKIPTDTLIQLSNTSKDPVAARCFYVNANGHCSNSGDACSSGAECRGGLCLPGWSETDFRVQLTARQPIAWVASDGLVVCTPAQMSKYHDDCVPLDGRTRRGPGGQSNVGTRIPPVSEIPFVGELRCVVVDDQGRPTDRNVLVGSATTVQAGRDLLDVTRDNAVGIPAVAGANNGDNTLRLGEEYAACPNTLIVNHLFDGAMIEGNAVQSVIVLTPCAADYNLQVPASIIAQILVFNEFEQRFSTSTTVQCFAMRALSRLDTTQPERSIFNVGIAGTLSGQTRIHGIAAGGHGLLGALYEAYPEASAAVNVHYQGISDRVDVIQLP